MSLNDFFFFFLPWKEQALNSSCKLHGNMTNCAGQGTLPVTDKLNAECNGFGK